MKKLRDEILSRLRLSVYERLLQSIDSGNRITMINIMNSGIIVDVEKVGRVALKSLIKSEKRRLKNIEKKG